MPPSPSRGLWSRTVSRGFVGGAGGRSRIGGAVRGAVVGRAGSGASKESPLCQVSASPVSGRERGGSGISWGCWLRGGRSGGGRSICGGCRRSVGRSRPVRGGPRARWSGLPLRGGALRGRAFAGKVALSAQDGFGLFGAAGNSPHCQVGGVFGGFGAAELLGVVAFEEEDQELVGEPAFEADEFSAVEDRFRDPLIQGDRPGLFFELERVLFLDGGESLAVGLGDPEGRCSGVRGRRRTWRRRSGRCRRSGRLRGTPAVLL